MPRELISKVDVCDVRGERCIFLHLIICWREDGKIYRIEHPRLTFDLDALTAPPPIPADHLYPKWREDLLEAPTPIPDDVFVKGPQFMDYDPEFPDRLPDHLLKEITVFEELRKSPHSNLCAYRGCVREGDRVVGIALQRYPRNLYDLMASEELLDRRAVVSDVKAALEHLHSLGFVHGDLSPANVMIDNGRAILIDFGATLREGERAMIPGTPGWYREHDMAFKENDYFSLGIMTQWLEHGEDLDPDDIPGDTPSAWSEEYLKPKVLICGSSLALENACDILKGMLGDWSRVTFMVNNTQRLRNMPCFTQLLDNPSVHVEEGDHLVRADYERAWRIASSGLRSGDLDIVLFLSSHDTDTASGAHAYHLETKRVLNVPMVRAWSTPSRSPDPWLVFMNFPSGKAEYITSLRHLAWHSCKSTVGTIGRRNGDSLKILRRNKGQEGEAEPACIKGIGRSRCYDRIAIVELSAVAAHATAVDLMRVVDDNSLQALTENWPHPEGKLVSRSYAEHTPEMWLELGEYKHFKPRE